MKKLVASLTLFMLITSVIFSGDFFGKRFFEIDFSLPVDVSNNTFMLDDFMKKQVVLDLSKMAEAMPESGFTLSTHSSPYLAVNFNIKDFETGITIGSDVYGKVGLSKDLFNFIGNGNELYKPLEVGIDLESDVFAHVDFKATLKIKETKFVLQPSIFVPVMHATTQDSKFSFTNDEEGTIGIDLKAVASLYTNFNFTGFSNVVEDITTFDYTHILNLMGLDISGTFERRVNDLLNLRGNYRIPILPGHLYNVSTVSCEMAVSAGIKSLAGGGLDGLVPTITTGLSVPVEYYINRPFNFVGIFDFYPLGEFMYFTGGVGIGIRNPFAAEKTETKVYPEYVFGVTLQAGKVLVFSAGTEYLDQLYQHYVNMKFNIRLFEMDVGVAAVSSDIASSFRGAGVSAFISLKTGF